MKSSPRWLVNKTPRPSGVQPNTVSSAECEVNCFAVPPPAGMMKTSRLPLRSLEKAIHLPSGEKARISIARFVHCQALDVLAILIGRPDIAKISKGDAAVRIAGITHQSGFMAKGE